MDETEEPKKKGGGKLLLVSISLASVVGAVLFAFVYSGALFPKGHEEHAHLEEEDTSTQAEPLPQLDFLELEPLLISLGSAASGKQLRFEGYLEINPQYQEDVTKLMPRIMDVLNTYLRAVEYTDIEEPSSLLRLRLQMLKRVQIVVGEGRVNDLLISKFLIS